MDASVLVIALGKIFPGDVRNKQLNSNPIKEVSVMGFCTGCGLCESTSDKGKVKVELSEEGYFRPQVNGLPSKTEIRLFNAVCPGVSIAHKEIDADAQSYPIWGPVISTQTGYATDDSLRRFGSSGGVISALSVFLLETGKVDFVAQNAVDPDDPLGNYLQVSRNRSDVLRAAGSRYAPSAPLKRIRELLDTGERFAFVGKPCDVAALRALSRVDRRVAIQVPYMLSFMCAGIPSRKGTMNVLKQLDVAPGEVASFRYRGDGWPGKTRAVTHSGSVKEMDYATSWGTILNRHLQFRCKICPDGTGEFADIVCADAWYGTDGYPSFEERDGRSLMLGRTKAGVQLIAEALSANALETDPLDIGEIAKMQPYQVTRKQVVLGRLLGARFALGRIPKYRNMGLVRAMLSTSPKTWLSNVLGTYRRARGEVA